MHNFLHLLVFFTFMEFGLSETSVETGCTRQEKAFIVMDLAKDYIRRANELSANHIDDDEGQNLERRERSSLFLAISTNLISDAKKAYPSVSEFANVTTPRFTEVSSILGSTKSECDCKYPKQLKKPRDCAEVLVSGQKKSGVYTIWPRSYSVWNKSIEVYCDMDTDGGGWTVIQRRGSFSTPKAYFTKNWIAYRNGFGNVTQEFWIGNENLHKITFQDEYVVRFDLVDANGETGFAQYRTFYIDEETFEYRLHIEGYHGNVGDAMYIHNKQRFSSMDRDNDDYGFLSCANYWKGGWWYKDCGLSNLNGLNQPGKDDGTGMIWRKWKEDVSLAKVEIKLRPWKIPNY